MSSPQSNPPASALSSPLPGAMIFIGGALMAVGALASFIRNDGAEFAFSWLLAFMFYYSVALGALFMVLVHHLTDAGWSLGIRRFCEHIASLLFPWLAVMFLPVLILAPKLYGWLKEDPATNNLIAAKQPLFTMPGFVAASALFFAVLWLLTSRLRSWSLRQDQTGSEECTRKLRFHSAWGIVAFGLVLTFSAVLWMKSLQYQWFSAMYGVYFFAASAWAGLAFIYVIAAALFRQGCLEPVLKRNHFYFIGVLLLAFTLLSSYTEFAQYFVVWNANVPEETFWYLIRENGNWWWLSMILILGKFFVPFFALLPVHAKTSFRILVPVCLLIAVMHAADLAFNILPARHMHGYNLKWFILPLGCILFMGGILAKIFISRFNAHPPYPARDPRLLEAMGYSPNVVGDLPDPVDGGVK